MGIFKLGKRFTKTVLLVLLIGVIAFAAGFLFSVKKHTGSEITSDTLFQQMQTVSKIATLEYHYTNMGKFEDRADVNGWAIPLTKKSFILTYDGKITAGIEMQEIAVEVKGSKIDITLPRAEILSHEVDEKSIELYDETKNIFNPISISDYAAFSAQQKEVMEQKTIEKGLLVSAQERAEAVIRQFLSGELDLAEYEIVFHTAPAGKDQKEHPTG